MVRPKSPVRLEWVDPAVCSLEYRLKIIGRLPFFKQLSAEIVSNINSLFHDQEVHANDRIYFEGDKAEYLFLVALGKVKLARNSLSGRELLLDILHSGEYFGNLAGFDGQDYLETAIAQTDGCILRISSVNFEKILKDHPEVTRRVLEAVNQRLAEWQEIIHQLTAGSVEQRIAYSLMRLAGKLGESRGRDVLIQLPFSRQDMAAMTGSSAETVSRVMSHFAEEALVKSGRRWVTVLDIGKLEQLAKTGAVN